MATVFYAPANTKIIRLPSRSEVRAMLSDRAVAITVVICTTVFGLGALAGVVWLTLLGDGIEAVGAFVLAMLGLVYGRVRAMHETMKNQADGSSDA